MPIIRDNFILLSKEKTLDEKKPVVVNQASWSQVIQLLVGLGKIPETLAIKYIQRQALHRASFSSYGLMQLCGQMGKERRPRSGRTEGRTISPK